MSSRPYVVLSDDSFAVIYEDGSSTGPYRTLQDALRFGANVDVSEDLFGIAAVMADPDRRSYPFVTYEDATEHEREFGHPWRGTNLRCWTCESFDDVDESKMRRPWNS